MSEVIIIATLANYKHFTFLTCRHDSVIVGQSKNVVFGTWGQHILTIFGIIQTFIIIQHFERVKKNSSFICRDAPIEVSFIQDASN
jgi:hypothetical protein